jgi:hypothetical protein
MQVAEWKNWIRVNEPYLRQRLSALLRGDGVQPLMADKGRVPSAAGNIETPQTLLECHFVIVIGRSSLFSEVVRRQRVTFKQIEGFEVSTYDRLFETAVRLDGGR